MRGDDQGHHVRWRADASVVFSLPPIQHSEKRRPDSESLRSFTIYLGNACSTLHPSRYHEYTYELAIHVNIDLQTVMSLFGSLPVWMATEGHT